MLTLTPFVTQTFRRIIIAPSAAGKTTFARRHTDVGDVDDSRNVDTEPQLRELRSQRNWPAHNRLWWAQLQLWAARLQPTITHIVAHSLADAQAIQVVWPHSDVVAVMPSEQTHRQRMRLRGLTGDSRALALLNRATVQADIKNGRLLSFSSFEEARQNQRRRP